MYSSQNSIRKVKLKNTRWPGHVVRMCEFRDTYQIPAGKPELERSVSRPGLRMEDTFKSKSRYDQRSVCQ
jgi:hypothetical protein